MLVRHRVHQVRLAETDAAVDEQRVVGPAGIVRDLNRRGLGELIALALDEAVEGEIGVEPRPDHEAVRAPWRAPAADRRGGEARGAAPRADLDRDDRDVAGGLVAQQLPMRGRRFADPVDDEAIRRQQPQRAVSFDGLQRPNPGVELLLGQLGLERTHAASPKRRFHA